MRWGQTGGLPTLQVHPLVSHFAYEMLQLTLLMTLAELSHFTEPRTQFLSVQSGLLPRYGVGRGPHAAR
jgi:hypothetical protein